MKDELSWKILHSFLKKLAVGGNFMSNVYKIGSRWGTNGPSVLGVFRHNNIVFIGGENGWQDKFKRVKKEDYFAISDGYTIVSVAKVISEPKSVVQFDICEEDKDCFDYEDWVMAARVKIVDLPKECKNKYLYKKQDRFFHIPTSKAKKYIDLYEKLNKEQNNFKIESTTMVLTSSTKEKSLLNGITSFVIPVYQRPYSWNEEQLSNFINDIFYNYWGTEKVVVQEPMFIGTMQLSGEKYIENNFYEQEIIDGQQRLSTLLVLLKTLQIKFPESRDEISAILDDRFKISTFVTKEQNKYLKEFKELSEFPKKYEEQNHYIRNATILSELIENNIEETTFNVMDFLSYLKNKIYFVVIITHAGLSKTLQIFNSINTTGLDLNAGDLFKIRFFEYLTTIKNEPQSVFDSISSLYLKVDTLNKQYKIEKEFISVLKIYKDYLISKYDLPISLYSLGTEAFYDGLFDALLGINEAVGFKNVKKVEISIRELSSVIDVIYEQFDYEKNYNVISVEEKFGLRLIRQLSRYGRYSKLITLARVNNELNSEKIDISEMTILLSKLFSIYSLRFSKVVNEMHRFINSLMKGIVKNPKTINELIRNKIKNQSDWERKQLSETLSCPIAYYKTWKNLACWISAYLYEINKNPSVSAKEIDELLFNEWYDIEHLHANADNNVKVDESLQNSIGNLVLLEYTINRSIGNKILSEKQKQYKNSKISEVRHFFAVCDKWDKDDIKARTEAQIEKIESFLFDVE